MKGLVSFFFILWSCYSMKNPRPTNFCVNCKHFIPNSMNGVDGGKCALFISENNNGFLVSGNTFKYSEYCGTARGNENMCGKEGKLFKRKYKKRVKKITPLE